MAKDFLNETHLVDLSDDELKETLGHTYNAIKDLAEKKATDPDLAQLRASLKNYVDDNYSSEDKVLKARMKAARVIAKARGIHWKLPEDVD